MLCWGATGKGSFTVSSFYKELVPAPTRDFPWKGIWKEEPPPKVAFFAWTTALGKILTIDNLIHWRKVLVNWCCMCKRDGESVSHRLFHCLVVRYLWCLAFSLFGISWVQQGDVLAELTSWTRGRMG